MPDTTKHILLVEPEPMLRRTVAMTARSLNLGQVHEAATSAAALRLLSVRTFQGAVIAVDCVGSGKDSRYDLGLIDRLIASVPVIALTAFSRKEDEQKVLAAGFDEFLAKPLVPAALLQTVAAVNARRTPLPV